MKSRSQELLDKSIAAMISAIEIYNKPDFKYREETFTILAINGWELLLKAKWLREHKNKISCLYVKENKNNKNGSQSKKQITKTSQCGNPITHGLDYLSKKLIEKKILNEVAKSNIDILKEIRDSSVHFYQKLPAFSLRIQEVGSASLKNYIQALKDWFDLDIEGYNFYLIPLAFVPITKLESVLKLNKEETNLVKYISSLEAANDDSDYAVSINVDVKFTRSIGKDALEVHLSNDPSSTKIQLTRKQFKDKYPLNYESLTKECRSRYSDFKVNSKYHSIRKSLIGNPKFSNTEKLDEDNPNSPKQTWFSKAIFSELDKHYTKIT